jgi:hypothetical protein
LQLTFSAFQHLLIHTNLVTTTMVTAYEYNNCMKFQQNCRESVLFEWIRNSDLDSDFGRDYNFYKLTLLIRVIL